MKIRIIIFFILAALASQAQIGRTKRSTIASTITKSAAQKAFFVSSSTGSDSNPGTMAAPFASITKVNTLDLSDTTKVYFKRGDTLSGTVTVGYNSVTYDAYGSGANPVIDYIDTIGYASTVIQNIDYSYDGYHFVSNSGNDSNDGATPSTAWATISKVNAATFSAGDHVLFDRGDTWREAMTVPSSGSAGNPVTFGVYGSGDKPVIDGADLITDFSQIYNVSNSWSVTFTTQVSNATYYNFRQVVAASASGSQIRIRISGSTSYSATINGCSIGLRSGTTDDFASAPTRITFNGGQNSITVPIGQTVYSDWMNISVSSGSTYLLHVYMSSPSGYRYASEGTAYRSTNSSDLTLTETVDLGTSGTSTRIIDKIEVKGSAVENLYEKTGISIKPNFVTYNDTIAPVAADTASLDVNGEWYWDDPSNTFYFYATSNPNSNVQVGQRQKLINLADKSYITLKNLIVQHSNESNTGDIDWYGAIYASGANVITIDNCEIKNNNYIGAYLISTDSITITNSTFYRNGWEGRNGENVRVQNTVPGLSGFTFTNNSNTYAGENGILITAADSANWFSNVHIENNTFSRCFDSGIYLQRVHNAVISNNVIDSCGDFTDTGEDYAIGIGNTDDLDIYGNTITNQLNNDAVQLWSDAAMGSSNNISIYRNIIDGVANGSCLGINAYDSLTARNVQIYYNVLANADNYGIHFSISVGDTAYVATCYNNTIYNSGIRSIDITPNFAVNLKNNIMYEPSTTYNIDEYALTKELTTSNNFWETSASGVLKYNGVAYTEANITTFEATAKTGTPVFTDAANGNFTLQTGSPAINNGTNVGLTTDILGNPIVGNPDIGAYEKQ